MEEIIENLKEKYDKLSKEVSDPLDNWIKKLKVNTEFNYNHTSYGIKHCFEKISSTLFGKVICISNDQFKYAMYKNNFKPDNYEDKNWCFQIAEEQDFKWE